MAVVIHWLLRHLRPSPCNFDRPYESGEILVYPLAVRQMKRRRSDVAPAPLRLFIQPSSVVIDRVDLALGAVPEEHILRQSLQRELTGRHQQALEHRLDRVELLGATPHAFFDLLRREI